MKLTNFQVNNIYDLLNRISSRCSDMQLKWNIALIAEPLYLRKQSIALQANDIIKKNGVKNEQGDYSLPLDDKEYNEFMGLENDIKIDKVKLATLEKARLSMEELIILSPIIDGSDLK